MQPVALITPSDGVIAYNLRYTDEAVDDDESDDSDERETDADEVWIDLRCKLGIVPCVRSDVRISNHGRISMDNVITRGTGGLGGYFCLLSSVPPVPIDRVTTLLFRPTARREPPPPRIRAVIALLKDGANIDTLQRRLRIKRTTAWSYTHEAMRFVSTKSAAMYTRRMLQAKDVEQPFRQLVDEAPALLHAPLRTIVELFTRTCMASNAAWRTNPHRYAEICAMRALVQREG